MSDAVLIFTFSPVQSFIAEARRTADLLAASRILVELAMAATRSIESAGSLVYPVGTRNAPGTTTAETPTNHIPNKIVAVVPAELADAIAEKAKEALLQRWLSIARSAETRLKELGPSADNVWQSIWDRQISKLWEVRWSIAPMPNGDYKTAHALAGTALDAAKRTRAFAPSEEDGPKDTLSGRRSALRTASYDARAYWAEVGARLLAPKLRPDGRERLDAIGAIKRFCYLADTSFHSASSVASRDFVEQAKGYLHEYRQAIVSLLGPNLHPVRRDDQWPYDGDLLYVETLTVDRLFDSYRAVNVDPDALRRAQRVLGSLYKRLGWSPCPYYAIIVLDGDGIGEHVTKKCLEQPDPQLAHSGFSNRLREFAHKVPDLVVEHKGDLVYNGGDDVLALAPLSQALPLAKALASAFGEITEATASAGIAVVHHLYPLDAALQAAREAEQRAKDVCGKAAVCVRVLRRSGEVTDVRSTWQALGHIFEHLVSLFKDKALSSRFAYDLLAQAPVISNLAPASVQPQSDPRQAILRLSMQRHKGERLTDIEQKVADLWSWAKALDASLPADERDVAGASHGFVELARWITFARFVAQGGGD